MAMYEELCNFTEGLGDEVQRKELKLYTAFKRIKNFVCFLVFPAQKDPRIQIYLKLPGELAESNPLCRDVSKIGHWATGDLEMNVRTPEEVTKAKELIVQSYESS